MLFVRPRALDRGHAGRLTLAAVLGAVFALAMVAPAFAQEATATDAPIGGSVSGYGVADWMNLVLRLALVLVIIWVAIVAMRWWVRRMNGAVGSNGGHLEIVETRSLGPNRSLQLVKIGGRAVLLGVTAEQISSVLEIDDPNEVERLARPSVVKEGPTSLSDAVSRLGALTSWRPVIERKRPAPQPVPMPPEPTHEVAFAAQRPQLVPAPPPRNRWVKLGRRIVGLEDPPQRTMPAGMPRAVTAAAQRQASAPAARAPRSMASAAATAAELPASRAARARSGYRENQISEVQRAISSLRSGTSR